MGRWVLRTSLAALAILAVGGCSRWLFEEREPWRDQAEMACLRQRILPTGAAAAPIRKIEGPGSCGALRPFRIEALAGFVALSPPAVAACPMTSAVDRWLAEAVQPAAMAAYGLPVGAVKLAGSYACRTRNNQRGAKKSEHAFANALDISGFQLADGRTVTVKKGWRGSAPDQIFLREVHASACNYFTTVLGPGSDIFHHDHFHIDLARHDARGRRRVCKPRPETSSVPTAAVSPTGPAAAFAPLSSEAPYADE